MKIELWSGHSMEDYDPCHTEKALDLHKISAQILNAAN